MCKDALFGKNDIPFCPTTAKELPKDIITWEDAKSIYKKNLCKKNKNFKHIAFVCFYMDDYKFDGLRGIWHDSTHALKALRRFSDVNLGENNMKKIRLMLEYKSYPIWIYNEEGFIEDNVLPEEWKYSQELINLTDEIQAVFDSLFIDTVNEFKYVGFSDMEKRNSFINKLKNFEKIIFEINNKQFIIQNDIDISNL